MKNERQRTVLVLGVGLLLVVGLYLVVWRPRAADVSQARRDTQAMAQELASLQAASAAAATPTTVDAASAAIEVAIPADPELPNLLRQLNAIAAETGVDQRTLTPSNLTANAGVPGASILLTISASGARSSAVEYVRRLSTLERLFVVDKVSFQAATATDPAADPSATADVIQVDVSGRVFTTAPAPATEA